MGSCFTEQLDSLVSSVECSRNKVSAWATYQLMYLRKPEEMMYYYCTSTTVGVNVILEKDGSVRWGGGGMCVC